MNNKLKVLKRVAYSFKNFVNFRLRIHRMLNVQKAILNTSSNTLLDSSKYQQLKLLEQSALTANLGFPLPDPL